MQFISEVIERGVAERRFDLTVGGERIPGIIWAPEGAKGARPLVLFGHGGTQQKRVENILGSARSLVRHCGYAVVAIDAPGHGDRITPEQAAREREDRQARSGSGRGPMTPEQLEQMAKRTGAAVSEWKATLDAVETLDYVGKGPVGYWGLSMGCSIGVPFVASEPRVKAAVLGLLGLRTGEFENAARSITIPLMFIYQWDDELASRDSAIALYDAFGSKEKTMHINPGRHVEVPLGNELVYWEAFYVRHLGSAKP